MATPSNDSRLETDTPYHQAQRYHFSEWVQRGLSAGLTPGQIAKALGRPLKNVRWLIEEEEEKRAKRSGDSCDVETTEGKERNPR